jgi:hypothetical protein
MMLKGVVLASSGDANLKRQLFTLSLLFSTWIPMAFFIAVGSFGTPNLGLQTTKTILLFLSGIHVPATLLLYVDKEFLGLIRENKARYVYLPITLSLGSGLIFAFGSPVVQAYLYLIYWAWQAHHYGRQNIGVYAFAAIAQGWHPHRAERRMLELTTVCGICGTFKILGMDIAPGYLLDCCVLGGD